MSTHLENVLMQQSYGPKSTMPTSRPTGELLLALNEFNKYELYTGTGTGVQPLISDGHGNSNVSFTVNQDSADTLNGKFVYFDNATNTWKPAYASAAPSQGDHFTAQGFAISMNSTGIQVTTSGKLIIPFRLTDYTGASVVAGSYYYLCQTEANAGMIQQSAPSSGIMQIVCQIIAVDDTSTTLLLLNDLSQVANDIIITDGDGSKYLGDDGQYHDMMVAGLAGRTSNCLDTYEVLDINFENIAAGRSAATAYSFPTLTANGTWDDATAAAAIAGSGSSSTSTTIVYSPTTLFNTTAGTNQVFTAADSVNNSISWKFLQSTYLTTITVINHTDAAQADNNIHTALLSYADSVGNWISTNYTITVPTNTAGAQYTLEIPLELSKKWGAHKFWGISQITSFSGSTETFATNKITPAGYYYTGAATASYGYVANGDITIEDNIASGFSNKNYVISKYLVEGYSQYSFRVRKKFDQVTNEDPIWQSPNKTNYLAIENGALKLVLNGLAYKGNLVYEANTWYDFKINYNMESGYVISVSSDNSDEPSWTNEIILYDEVNYLDGTTWYLGVASLMDEFTVGTGQIDLAHTGMDYVNSAQSFDTYPLSDSTAKNIATITVTFKGTGLTATGRANNTTTLNAQSVDVDTVENTIIAQDTTDLLWNTQTGLTTANYTEVDYLRQYEDGEQNTVVYARDTNQCYSYTIVYPNFLQTNVSFEKDAETVRLDLSEPNATFHPNTFLNRNGFNFQLKLDLTGNLKLDRTLDARNYGSAQAFPFYYQVQGVDWSTFQGDGGYTQGIKMSAALGSTNTGTAAGSLYQMTVNDSGYADASYAAQNACGSVFYYFAFEKPIKFSTITFRNYSDANYIPVQYCLHVSNDMNTWESILPTTVAGYVANGMFGNLPMDAYANFPNRTVNALHNVAVTMPDSNQYYKYVRIGAFMGATNTYRPVLSGCWIGMTGVNATFANNAQTAKELIFEKQNFINTETSGINAQVVRKKIGTAYQVRFLDKIGYVETPPEEGITDSTGKQLAKNDEEIYKDERLQNQITTQRLAYQTHCPVFINEERDYGYGYALNPFNDNESGIRYSGCANTGTVANSFNLLNSTTTGYDFANALNASSFIITFTNKAFVDYFYIQNHTTVAYNAQQVKVYGSVNGGSFTGTVGEGSAITTEDAEWEEIPILNMVTAYNNGDFEHFAPTEQMNTYTETASTQAITKIGTAVADDSYGAYNLYIAPKKAYQQYRIDVQRTVNNRVIEMTIQPKGVWFDPWATPLKEDGTNAPLLAPEVWYPSSSATALPDKATLKTSIYTSPYSATTVWQLYQSSNNGNWTPENSRRYVYLQQAYPYTVNMNGLLVQHGNDLNYAANLFEYFGTTNTALATTVLSNTNSLLNWSRITSLMDKADVPTAVGTTAKNNELFLGDKEYGYNYFTAVFRRSINNQIYMDSFKPKNLTSSDFTSDNLNNYLNASKITEEWKWTNVAGEKDEIREAACYNHPLLTTGDTSSLTPSYELTTRPVYNPDNGMELLIVGNVQEHTPVISINGILSNLTNINGNQAGCVLPVTAESMSGKSWSITMSYNLVKDASGGYGDGIGIKLTKPDSRAGFVAFGSIYMNPFNGRVSIMFRSTVDTNNEHRMYWSDSLDDGKVVVRLSYDYPTRTYTAYLGTSLDDLVQVAKESDKDELYFIQLRPTFNWTIGFQDGAASYNFVDSPTTINLAECSITIEGRIAWSGAYPTTFYTTTQGEKDSTLPNNTAVYRTTSMVANKTFPYENRWMYKFTDSDDNIWYSPTAPTGTAGTLNSYMYKNIIPKYNTEVYTGIPMTATANEGSENGYTYFDQSLTTRPADAVDAWNAFASTTQTTEQSWSSGNAFDTTTGLCTEADREIYVGFQAPEAITVQGYTIKGMNGTSQSGIAQWEFQGSNNGTEWTTIDTRDTEAAESPSAPVNMDCGTSYFFNNEDSYTYYRWLIKKITPGVNFCRLQVPCLYVLEENPVKVYSIFELTYTDSQSVQHTAYTSASGVKDSFVDNNETVYSDINLLEPITNVWAYQVTDGDNNYWTKVAGDAEGYAPETTMIYEDPDFTTEFGEALVDTWKYTGTINKKYKYTGKQINNFTWDGEEPYNKYFYTGNVANQYKYTGKIEGWTYTGVTKDIYDVVPNFHLSLNRDDARKIQKATLLGNAYPVATSASSLDTTVYWSFTSSDVAGTIVPSGTPLYSQLTDTEPTTTADGTQSYVFGSQPSQSRYKYEYLYTAYNDLPEGQSLTGDEQAYQDADLTITAPEDTDLTQYTYTNDYEASHLTDFYHRITEVTPVEDYNFGLQFDGSKYTFTNYVDDGTVDSQEFVDGTLIKSSYQGPDASVRNSSVIMMTQQDLLKLNLTKSVYSWWTWNNLYEQQTTRTPVSIFRLATIDGSSASIEDVYELYPWRVGDVSTRDTNAIGDPIITLSNKLKSNEIWLEGQTLEIAKYRKLFKVYGTTWGGDGQTTFGVPDFRNRAIWGSGDGTFGYIEAGLPDITVSMASAGAHTHTRGGMEISGNFSISGIDTYVSNYANGAFSNSFQNGPANGHSNNVGGGYNTVNFTASRNWTGSTSSDGSHSHTLTVTKNASIYGNSSTVQPNALKIRVKCKAK